MRDMFRADAALLLQKSFLLPLDGSDAVALKIMCAIYGISCTLCIYVFSRLHFNFIVCDFIRNPWHPNLTLTSIRSWTAYISYATLDGFHTHSSCRQLMSQLFLGFYVASVWILDFQCLMKRTEGAFKCCSN